jgi:uncharacterized protein YjbI with pentapeptide repeats
MWKRLRELWLSRTRAARMETPAAPDPPAPDPELTEKFAKQAHDLDALRKTVEDAAAVSAGFWLSYLFVLFYIGIAAGAVTHRDLLLESPVKLPFLNIELPLVAFFLLAPIIFIVSHAYTLVHFVMLGAKVGVYDAELRAQLGDAAETRDGLRRQLPSNIFVQFLAGPGDIRNGGLGRVLKAIAWISLVFSPVLLLLLIQVQFLPYHLWWVTWVQRFAVLVDLVLLWALWPAVLNGRSEITWPRLWRYPVLTLASLVPIGLAFTAATFPGEAMDDWIGKKQGIPPNPVTAWLGLNQEDEEEQPIWTSFHDLLFNGEIDPVSRHRKSPFSNTLVVSGLDALEAKTIDDQKKLDWAKHTLVLRGRHLEGAVLDRADLRKADLESVYLQGASLNNAQLQGAAFNDARLWGAALSRSELQGASLDNAQLQGASLNNAQLQGASLDGAQLQGVSLDGAQLQGCSLWSAKLQGASLKNAQLQGASLDGAQLQGASLWSAKLQGASLGLPVLPGVPLDDAQLQGTTLLGTDMSHVAVWRTSFQSASLDAVFEDGLKESSLTKGEFAALKVYFMKEAPEGGRREQALKRIEILNPDIFGPEASEQKTLEDGRVDRTAYRGALADQLKSLACSGDEDALHILHGLKRNGRIEATGAEAPSLVEAILKPDCPVSAALTEADRAALKRIANEVSGTRRRCTCHGRRPPRTLPDGRQSDTAILVARGTRRLLRRLNFSTVTELPLLNSIGAKACVTCGRAMVLLAPFGSSGMAYWPAAGLSAGQR